MTAISKQKKNNISFFSGNLLKNAWIEQYICFKELLEYQRKLLTKTFLVCNFCNVSFTDHKTPAVNLRNLRNEL